MIDLKKYNLANFHNYVIPCAPDKIPVIVNSIEHDSFSQFRSENLNITYSFKCAIVDPFKDSTAICKFYASTSRFLERIKCLLSSVTRPTKRGPLFMNLKPRKPLLSRHYKCVNFNFDLPKINVIYWSSANEKYGLHLEAKTFNLNHSQRLELVPHFDGLKRRPRPAWSIDLMKFNVENVLIYLMSPPLTPSSSKKDMKNNDKTATTTTTSETSSSFFSSSSSSSKFHFNRAEFDLMQLQMNNNKIERSSIIKLFEIKTACKNFFLKIDSIYYEREKSSTFNNPHFNKSTVNHNNNNNYSNLNNKSNSLHFINNNYQNDYQNQNETVINTHNNLNRFSYSLKTNETKKMRNVKAASSSASYANNNNDYNCSSFRLEKKHSSPEHLLYHHSRQSYLNSDLSLNANTNTLTNVSMSSLIPIQFTKTPKHNLIVKNLKCKWNTANRDVVYNLYDIYNKSKQLRHNLSSQALKEYDLLTDQIVQNYFLNNSQLQKQRKSSVSNNVKKTTTTSTANPASAPYSPYSTIRSSQNIFQQQQQQQQTTDSNDSNNNNNNKKQFYFEDLLKKLDSERGENLNIYCNEDASGTKSSTDYFENFLYALNSINKMSDIQSENVSIEFHNCQIKLSLEDDFEQFQDEQQQHKSDNSSNNILNIKQQVKNLQNNNTNSNPNNSNNYKKDDDYLIISAARANVFQCIHDPVWKSQRYLEKTSLSGYLENMQYFATLANNNSSSSPFPNSNEKPSKSKSNEYENQANDEYWLSDVIINDHNNYNDSSSSPTTTAKCENFIIDIKNKGIFFIIFCVI
jgi:hypothetical protein